jgi:hypothetical protein
MEIPILALDGTGSGSLWKSLAPGYEVKLGDQESWQYTKVTQLVSGGNFYLKTWEQIDNSHPSFQMLRMISNISASRGKDVIICGSKKVNKIIQQHLPTVSNLKYMTFYALTGDNSAWKNADTLVIVWRPTPPRDQYNAMVKCTGFNEEVVKYITTTSEIVQGIGRLRQCILFIPEKDHPLAEPRKTKRPELNIVIFPEMRDDNNPMNELSAQDVETYIRIQRGDYIEALEHGYTWPVPWLGDKFRAFMPGGISKTTTEMRREFGIDAPWIEVVRNWMCKPEGRYYWILK